MQQEQHEFLKQIHKIQDENNELNSKLDVLKNATQVGETRDDATREKLTSDAVKNVMRQIEYLQAVSFVLQTDSVRKSNLYCFFFSTGK